MSKITDAAALALREEMETRLMRSRQVTPKPYMTTKNQMFKASINKSLQETSNLKPPRSPAPRESINISLNTSSIQK